MKNFVVSIGILLALCPFGVHSEIVYTSTAKIGKIWTWAETGAPVDRDAVLHLNTGIEKCPKGVFIQGVDASSAVYSSALTAYVSKMDVRIQIHDDILWSGANTPYCKVRAVFLE